MKSDVVWKVRLAVLLLAAVACGDVWAAHHGGSGGRHSGGGHRARTLVVIGAPIYPWYASGYYSAPATVVLEPPPVYVQRSASPAQLDYWYYCRASGAFYPYVTQCPGGWQAMLSQPAAQP
jgi:hypothetical protein